MREGERRVVRVAFVGNVANCLYQIAKALREVEGWEPHLYVGTHESLTNRPESVDPSWETSSPDWIHIGPWVTPRSVLLPWRAPITRELAGYDLVVVSGPGPIFAQFSGRPWCWWVSGADLTVKPFPLTFFTWYRGWRQRIGEVVGGVWQRRASRQAAELWLQPFRPMVDAAQRLHIDPARLSNRYLPLVVDVDEFHPGQPGRELPDALAAAADADLVVFHPSRLVMDRSPRLVRTGQWKGNDVLFRGFARFVRSHPAARPVLVLLDSGLSREMDEARALVRSLGIEDRVVWLRAPREGGFTRREMVTLYQASDVVVDEFGVGWFGFVALEGAATGVPVLTHLDAEVVAGLYPGDPPPFLEASDEQGVADVLGKLSASPDLRRTTGAAGRRWVVRHHAWAAASTRYVEALRAATAGLAERLGRADT